MTVTRAEMAPPRTAERAEFLTYVLVTAVEGGINYWAAVTAYRYHFPEDGADLPGGAEPGPGGTANAYATVRENGSEPGPREFTIGIEDIEQAFTRLAAGPVEGLADEIRAELLDASAAGDAGEIDAGGADVVFQTACFGRPING